MQISLGILDGLVDNLCTSGMADSDNTLYSDVHTQKKMKHIFFFATEHV